MGMADTVNSTHSTGDRQRPLVVVVVVVQVEAVELEQDVVGVRGLLRTPSKRNFAAQQQQQQQQHLVYLLRKKNCSQLSCSGVYRQISKASSRPPLCAHKNQRLIEICLEILSQRTTPSAIDVVE